MGPSVTESTVEPVIVPMDGPRVDGRTSRGHGPGGARVSTGSLCLDLVATRQGPDGGVGDHLSGTEQLGRWLQGPGLPLPSGGLTSEDLSAVRALRAAVERAARAVLSGGLIDPADVRCINIVGQRPTPVFLLRATGTEHTVVDEADIAAVLSVIARDAIHLLSGTDRHRLRECAREGCHTLFLDRSPSGRRRWCSMKGCGEMVASAAYRRRHLAEAAG